MRHYLVTFHETDENDTTVYDCVVNAEDENGAFGKVADEIAKRLDTDGRPYSEDGGFGFWFDCTCDDADYCDGHGGIVMRTAEPFEAEEDAIKEQQAIVYHVHMTVKG